MNNIKKNRIIFIIFLGLSLTYCSKLKNYPEEVTYLSSPKNIPEWAEQGNFRFIRLDGGRIESLKAERTLWGKDFSKQEKDILSHIYDTHFNKILGLLKQADFNWVWVTWSNGWSLKDESENREQLKKIIELCHGNGIRVTAYMSAVNMFWESTYRDEPESKNWGFWKYDIIPLYCGGWNNLLLSKGWKRRIADVRKPEWQAYLQKKAELAVDAGVDGIFFDNIIGGNTGLKVLLSEMQEMAERKAKDSGRSKVLISANKNLSTGRFVLSESCDDIWSEAGKDTPGLWGKNWQINNVRKIKFLNAEKQPWQPLKFENYAYHCGQREVCIPTPIEQKLSIAEAYSFGADLSRNIEGRFLMALITDEKEALDAWAAIAQYNRFLDEHRDLYHDVEPVARIALLSEEHENAMADYFIKSNVMFETKVEKHLTKGLSLNNFKTLVIPFCVKELDEAQKNVLTGFVSHGGKIFSIDPERLAGKIGVSKDKITNISIKILAKIKLGQPANDFIEHVESASGGPLLKLENSGHLVSNITKKKNENTFIIHLINYDQDRPVENGKIKLDLSDQVKDLSGYEIKVISPDKNAPQVQNISMRAGKCQFNISSVDHYAVAVISDAR